MRCATGLILAGHGWGKLARGRFFAAAVTIEMAVWGLVSLAIWWRGGGPWSVDRRLGWEL